MKKSKINYANKKACCRCICVLLSFVFLLALFPTSSVALITGLTEGDAAIISPSSSEQDSLPQTAFEVIEGEDLNSYTGGITEIAALREENVKHFKLTNGTYEAISYGTAVHRLDASGEWKNIDNSLTLQGKIGNNLYTTKDQRVAFAKEYSFKSPLIVLNENGYSIAMSFISDTVSVEDENFSFQNVEQVPKVEALVTNSATRAETARWETIEEAIKIDNKALIRYPNIKSNIDIEYILEGNDVKENIIIKTKGDEYIYSFGVSVIGLDATLTEQGEIVFTDTKTGRVKYLIPAPYMFDSNGDISHAVSYELSGNATDGYQLRIIADANWINTDERAFPVTVDPTIVTTSNGLMDTYIRSDTTDTNYETSETLWVSSNQISFIKMNTPSLPSGATINFAMLHAAYYSYADEGSLTATAYQVLRNFDYNTLTWTSASAYTNKGISTTPLGSAVMYASPNIREATPGEAQFEITEAVEDWYDSPYSNYGVAIVRSSGTNSSVILKSDEAGDGHIPYLRVAYTHVFPEGVYAFRSAYSVSRFMTVENGSNFSGAHIQQKSVTGDHPALTFDRSSLFKISRIADTEYYTIRPMQNNTLFVTVSGSNVITKPVPINASDDILMQDAFLITWAGEGFYIRHAQSGKLLNMSSTSTANLNAIAVSLATSKSVWYPLQYSGQNKTGLVFYGSTTALAGDTVEYTPIPYSTIIDTNEPYMYVDESAGSVAAGTWDSTRRTLSVTFHSSGTVKLNFQIKTGPTPTHFYFANVTILFDDGIIHTIKNVSTNRLICPSETGSNSIITSKIYDSNQTSMMWKFEYVGNGYYKIKNDVTGYYLCAPSDNTDNASIIQSTYSSTYGLWKFIKSGNYYKIQSKNQFERSTETPLYLRMFGANLVQSSTETSNTWIIKALEMNVNVYYDPAFESHYVDASPEEVLDNILINSNLSIEGYITFKDAYKETFGIKVVFSYSSFRSYPYQMGCEEKDNYSGVCNNCFGYEFDGYEDVDYCMGGFHHKSASEFVNTIPNQTNSFGLLFTGHETSCGYNYDGNNQPVHEENKQGLSGRTLMAQYKSTVFVGNHSQKENYNKIKHTAFHEILHILGADHHIDPGGSRCTMNMAIDNNAQVALDTCLECFDEVNQNKLQILYYHNQ